MKGPKGFEAYWGDEEPLATRENPGPFRNLWNGERFVPPPPPTFDEIVLIFFGRLVIEQRLFVRDGAAGAAARRVLRELHPILRRLGYDRSRP